MIEWLNTPGLPVWVHLVTAASTIALLGLLWAAIWAVSLRWAPDRLAALLFSAQVTSVMCCVLVAAMVVVG